MLPVALILLAAGPGPARELAVFDLSLGPGVDKGLAPFLSQVIANEVVAATGKQPMLSSDLAAMLGFERQRQLVGCTESGCMAELSAALGLPRALSGSVTVSEERYLVTLTLLDVQHAQPLARFADTCEKKSDALTGVLQRAVRQLFEGAKVPAPPVPAVAMEAPSPRSHLPAYVIGGAAIAFAAGGGIVGSVALGQAQANQADRARNDAHLADACYVGAAASAAVAAYLYFRRSPAMVSLAPGRDGATLAVGGSW